VPQQTGDGSARPGGGALGPGALGRRATLVHFSSAFCQPCRATRRILREVSGMVPGVAHAELDAEEHLALVRESGIRSTPAVLVLDAAGREVSRAYGQPRKADVIAALGAAVAAAEGCDDRDDDGDDDRDDGDDDRDDDGYDDREGTRGTEGAGRPGAREESREEPPET
jgi:hypothetical protein